MSGRNESESVAALDRNRWPDCSGMGGRFAPEYAREEISHDKDGVHLMTIHRAKGLEFPVIFLIGMVDKVLPHNQGDIEEERRIAFVGMSRAMKLLYLSHSHNYLGRATKRSPFLEEIQDSQ